MTERSPLDAFKDVLSGTARSKTRETASRLTRNSLVRWLSARCCLRYSPVFSRMLTAE